MANTVYRKDSVKGKGETRITRGIKLYRNHEEEIADIGDEFFVVPSSEPGRSYVVDLEREVCDCRDYEIRRAEDRKRELRMLMPVYTAPCKHITAATIYRAKGGGSEWSPSPVRECRRAAA
jgi:hypothetical protein